MMILITQAINFKSSDRYQGDQHSRYVTSFVFISCIFRFKSVTIIDDSFIKTTCEFKNVRFSDYINYYFKRLEGTENCAILYVVKYK